MLLGPPDIRWDLVCRNDGRRSRVERDGTLTIHRLPSLPRALGPLHAVANFPHPFNPVWLRQIASVVRTARADLILVRDIPLVIPAVMLGRLYRLPVVLDLAENYPAMLRDRIRYTPTRHWGRMIRHPALAHVIERLGPPLGQPHRRCRRGIAGSPDQGWYFAGSPQCRLQHPPTRPMESGRWDEERVATLRGYRGSLPRVISTEAQGSTWRFGRFKS